MAMYKFEIQKSFCFLLCLSFTFFALLVNKVNSAETVSFSFPKFVPNQSNLIFQRDPVVTSSGSLQLTKVVNGKPVSSSIGRVLYRTPVHIWDSTTGNVASFVSSFSFVIKAPNMATSAEGIAFFLGPVNSQPTRVGPYLGLFDNSTCLPSYKIVAVEVDAYSNRWDPKGRHVGINVNCIASLKTAPWNLTNGEVANVVIRYEASTTLLTASLIHPSAGTGTVVSATVNVKNILPEWVSVGLSATTSAAANYIESHDIMSWSFESKLPDGDCNALENDIHELHDSI